MICLLILAILDKKIIEKNLIVNCILKVVSVIALLVIYFVIDLELGLRVPCTIIGMYIAEKLSKIKKIGTEGYIIVIFSTLVLALFADYKNFVFNLPSVISVLLIALYNGERGSKNKILKNLFYIFYPLHHVILYIIALVITHKVR